jgi:hypothetical protein
MRWRLGICLGGTGRVCENIRGAFAFSSTWIRWDLGQGGSIETVDECTGEVRRLHGEDGTSGDLEWVVWWISHITERI